MPSSRIVFITGTCAMLAMIALWSPEMQGVQRPAPDRQRAQQLFQQGNWQEAYVLFRQLSVHPETDPRQASQDLTFAVQCLNQLGRIAEFDALVEATIDAHQDSWRVLQAAAREYRQIEHSGFLIAGKFERGPHRGGGKQVLAFARDRVRSMQLLEKARPMALRDDNKPEVASFFLEFAETVRRFQHGSAFMLQTLTNLKELPDYDEFHFGYGFGYGYTEPGAPVDAEGNPVFYQLPRSWEAAASDGERWRWLLSQVEEINPSQRNLVRWHFAEFHWEQFGVQTMQHGFFRPQQATEEGAATGTYALHTLSEKETIARLATGIRRFELPDEFNFIRIFQEIAAEPKTGYGQNALGRLAEIFENRRQYPPAADYWKKSIELYGPGQNNWKRDRLQQILGNWGRFEPVSTQAAGQGATVDFLFRNAQRVDFVAHRIDISRLITDLKAYVKSDPRRLDWGRLQIDAIGYRLVTEGEKKYVGDRVAQWTNKLDPRPNHFDRRVTITTPLKDPGAYLVTATLADGNVSKIVLWVDDTVIVKKPLSGQHWYFVADATTGEPVANANLEFFGVRQEAGPNRQLRLITKNFAEATDANGQLTLGENELPNGYQWLVVARTKAGRMAHLGFRHVWVAHHHDQEYHEVKALCITDRPVYRPEQKVQFKFWVRHAQYDNDGSDFAGQTIGVELRDPMGKMIKDWSLQADEYGGVEGQWAIPAGAALGDYHLSTQYTSGSFRVEEYKKPEFEVSIEAPTKPVMLGEKITAQIQAKYYFGSPVTQATVKYKVLRQSREQTWYPIAPWDWCFGRGYWWFAYDYPWYPGWQNWVGCERPWPWWWPTSHEPPEVIAEQEVPIGADGKVSVEIDTQLAKELHGDTDHEYTITAEVRDESRRTIVGQGQVLVARKPFKIYTWVDRGFYRVGDNVTAHFLAQTIDQQPVPGDGTLRLLKISYPDARGEPVETEVQSWELATNAEGRARQQIEASAPGQYRLSYKLTDAAGHTLEGGYVFTIIGEGFNGRQFRFNHLELIPERAEYAPGETVKLQINTDRVGSTVLLFVRPSNGVYLPPQMLKLSGKSALYDIAVARKDMPNFFVEAVTIADGEVYRELKEIVVPPEKRVLNVEVTPSDTNFKPGQKAEVDIRLTDLTGENFVGQTVVAIYDKSVEYISGGSNVPDIKEFFWKWRRHHHPQQDASNEGMSANLSLPNKPEMAALGVFGHTVADEWANGKDAMKAGVRGQARMQQRGGMVAMGMGGFGGGMGGMEGADLQNLALPSMPMASEAAYAPEGGELAQAPVVVPTVRSSFADTALWVGALVTDQDGKARVSLDMPENLTTWKIRVWGMGHGTRVGSGEAEVITRKDLIVRLQAPRFFVQKDEVVLSANIHNYLPEEQQVTAVLEIDGNQLRPMGTTSSQVKVPADGEARVDWRVAVVDEGQVTVRMKALTSVESDAMEMKFPCYVHGLLKTESWAGTVRPDMDRAQLTIRVPEERRPDQTRLEVRYSPTLAGAMVDALPYLASYPYGCTEQTLNRFLPSVITQRMLIDMNLNLDEIRDKRTNLNAQEIGVDRARAEQWQRYRHNPVFDREELDRMVKAGVTALTNMQCSDGGWGWFSGWGEQSWPHTTAVVVHGLQIAQQNDVPLVPGVLENGIEWLKRYQAEQTQRLNNATKKVDPWKEAADELDAMVYMILVDAGHPHDDMREFLYRDRNRLAVYAKSMFALALHQQGEGVREQRDMLMRNISQFLVQDAENETAYLRLPESNYWWYWYGNDVEANAYYLKLLARVDPRGETASRLVKYLLNQRKHATHWSSTRDTAVCVEAFGDYLRATGEAQPNMVVEIWIDGAKRQEVEITGENLFSFDNQFLLEGQDLTSGEHAIEIRRRGQGPVYFNAYLTNFTLEDPITKAGLEVKVERKFYRLVPIDAKETVAGSRGQAIAQKVEKYRREPLADLATLVSGELVEVELEIESKNDYEYLMFEDMKAAGFEPVEVRSGYTGNEMGAYVEFRDNRVTFFVRALARGKHSLSYRLRAEIPGRFSALPAVATGMYAPELKGNSDEMKLQIEDR